MNKVDRLLGTTVGRSRGLGGRAAGALAALLLLAACQADEVGYGYGPKDQRPVSPKTQAKMVELGMSSSSPVLMRIFKEENTFEVWKMDRTGHYALLNTYQICKWSGDLGPKIREGDRQAPEGFYPITPGLMNPKSDWYLAFNTGFPNAYDRANGRTGSALMVHGSCSSRGCYAMTDQQIQEIYALARDAFKGGQKYFQLEAFPFHLTAENMARHWKDPNMPFWKTLKEGYDTFELTRLEPKVDVCGRQYVFNAKPDAALSPVDPCPALNQPADLVASLAAKAKADDARAEVLFAQIEEKRKVDEDKAIMLAQAEEKRKADAEAARQLAEARRIEAERNPGAVARLFGATPDPDAGIAVGPVVVPPTGAPVPDADPRGPAQHMLAMSEPVPETTGSTGPTAPAFSFTRLFSLASPEPKGLPIVQPAAAATMPVAPAPVAAGAVAASPPTAAQPPLAVTARQPAAPVVAAEALPTPALAAPAPACAPAGTIAAAGTPACPTAASPEAPTPVAEAPTASPGGFLGRLRSWF